MPKKNPTSYLASLPEVRITLIYIIVGCAWIIGSDMVVDHLAHHDPRTILLQSFKGINFVITTGFLLHLVLRRAFSGWRAAEESRATDLANSNRLFRALSKRIQSLREEERRRIAREIHDELGQQLTGIKMKLGLAEKLLERKANRELTPVIDLVVENIGLIDDAIDSVRRVASGLRPLALDHLGLASALEEEAREFSRLTSLPCEISVDGMDDSLAEEVRIAAFRIFQESLTNIARHAKANRVTVECAIRNGALHLRVDDDGKGIPDGSVRSPSSLGMLGMRERAEAVGGTLEFGSSPNQGTRVALVVPLDPPAPVSNEPTA